MKAVNGRKTEYEIDDIFLERYSPRAMSGESISEEELMNLLAHGMEGFDYALAKEKLGIPENYTVEMMIAVGKHGNVADLPEPLRARENPSDRKPLSDLVFKSKFPS